MKKVIDATDKSIGRVATEAAMALMGKDNPSYQPNVVTDVTVVIENASKSSVTDKKKDEKQYARYSGYPGGLKFTPLRRMIETKGYEGVYNSAVRGMLPSNRLRSPRLKNLQIND